MKDKGPTRDRDPKKNGKDPDDSIPIQKAVPPVPNNLRPQPTAKPQSQETDSSGDVEIVPGTQPASSEKRDPLGLDLCGKTHIIGLDESFSPGKAVGLAEANGWWQQTQSKRTELRDPDLEDPNVLAKMKHKEWNPVIILTKIHSPAVFVEYMLKLHIPMKDWPKGLASFYEDYKDIPEISEEDFL